MSRITNIDKQEFIDFIKDENNKWVDVYDKFKISFPTFKRLLRDYNLTYKKKVKGCKKITLN